MNTQPPIPEVDTLTLNHRGGFTDKNINVTVEKLYNNFTNELNGEANLHHITQVFNLMHLMAYNYPIVITVLSAAIKMLLQCTSNRNRLKV